MEQIPNSLIYNALQGKTPDIAPQSCYVAIAHSGRNYHLFNAERISLGRMAEMCANFIRGKHKPTYAKNKDDLGDVCVIVNAKNLHVTGRKFRQKLYRHHTGYPGGLKEINLRDLLEKDPSRAIKQAIRGMMPKNNIRADILE